MTFRLSDISKLILTLTLWLFLWNCNQNETKLSWRNEREKSSAKCRRCSIWLRVLYKRQIVFYSNPNSTDLTLCMKNYHSLVFSLAEKWFDKGIQSDHLTGEWNILYPSSDKWPYSRDVVGIVTVHIITQVAINLGHTFALKITSQVGVTNDIFIW